MTNVAFVLDATAFQDIYGRECLDAIALISRLLGPPLTSEELMARPPAWIEEIEVLFTGWGGPRCDQALLDRLPRLRTVFYGAGSLRSVATEACWERGIVFVSAAALNAVPVVEYSLGAILLSFKRVWHHARWVRAHRGYTPLRPLPMPTGAGAVVGLVSLGLIGRGVAERLRGFDVRVLAHDPLLSPEQVNALGAELVSLDELFAHADIVSLHTPLLPETGGFIDRRLLDRLKPNATFINTARGGLVRETDLIAFLVARPDVQAILDVTDPEPPLSESPLYDLPNVLLTPHIAGSIGGECRRMGWAMVEEFHRLVRGEPLRHEVSREQLARMA